MKTYKNLYSRTWAYDNHYAAWRRLARVAGFEYALIDNLLRLEEGLRTTHEDEREIGIF